MAAAVAMHGVNEVIEDGPLLELAGLGHGEQPGQGDLSPGAPVAVGDLANQHEQTQHALAKVVSRLHALVFQEGKQLFPMNVGRERKIAHLAVFAVEIFLRQFADLLL